MSKTVLITGGSRGIGRAMVEKFGYAGYTVHFCYKNSVERAAELTLKMRSDGADIYSYACDVADKNQVGKMTENVLSVSSHIDTLINNAGVAGVGMLCDICESDWNAIFDVNVKGVFNVTQSVMRCMVERKKGSILNISSVWGEIGASCEVAYSAAKAAVIGFTKALSKELGPSGVRVNCITPGVIETEMLSTFSLADIRALADMTALCRVGRPREIADAAFFLSEDTASFITGQILGVSGGFPV